MRPGLVFVGLFALLTGVYFLVSDTLGNLPTFLLQAAIVVVLVAAAARFRRSRAAAGQAAKHKAGSEASDDQELPKAS